MLASIGSGKDENYDQDTLSKLTPESFVIHFLFRRCQFPSSQFETDVLAEIIAVYNAVILRHETDHTDDLVTQQEMLSSESDYVRGRHKFFSHMAKLKICSEKCKEAISDSVARLVDDLYERLDRQQLCSTPGLSSQHDEDDQSLDIISDLTLIKHPRSRLNFIRGDPRLLNANMLNDCDQEAYEECPLCNMICFKEWFEIIEDKIIDKVLLPRCNKDMANPNLFHIRFCDMRSRLGDNNQRLSGRQRKLYMYLFDTLGENLFYTHATKSPICSINRARSAALFNKQTQLPCGKSVVCAVLYLLYIRAKKYLGLSALVANKIVTSLDDHGINTDQQAIHNCLEK